MRHLAGADASVLLVSAADRLHNARSVVADLRTVGDAAWNRFTAPREESLWSYRAQVNAFRANPAHRSALIDELDRTVREMERLAAGYVAEPDCDSGAVIGTDDHRDMRSGLRPLSPDELPP